MYWFKNQHYYRHVEDVVLYREDSFPDFPLEDLIFVIHHQSATGAKQFIDFSREDPSARSAILNASIYKEFKFHHAWQLCCKRLEGPLRDLLIFQYSANNVTQYASLEASLSVSTGLRRRVFKDRLEKQYAKHSDQFKENHAAKAHPVNIEKLRDLCGEGILYEGLEQSQHHHRTERLFMQGVTDASTLWCPKLPDQDFRFSIVVSSHYGEIVAEARRRSIEELRMPLGVLLFTSMDRSWCRQSEKKSSKKLSDALQATLFLSGDYMIDIVLDTELGMKLIRQLL